MQPGEDRRKFVVYRILGILINGISIFFLLNILLSFFTWGFQPLILLILFFDGCMLIYSNLSLLFGRYVLRNKAILNPRVRDWIRANAIVTFAGTGIAALVLLISLANWPTTKSLIDQKQVPARYFEYAFVFLLAASLLFIIHVLFTWKYLREFRGHFQAKT